MRVVLDIETTGLSPIHDMILEVAAIIVDDNLSEVDSFERRIHYVYPSHAQNQFVRDMHTKNGLWADCLSAEGCPEDMDIALSEWLTRHGATDRSVEIVGFSVHFDHTFLSWKLPLVGKLLSHRIIDLSSVNTFLVGCGYPNHKPAEMPHRAMADCRIELELWRTLHSMAKAAR